MEHQKDYKNLIVAVIAIITLIFGGSYAGDMLGITNEQGSFFGGMVFLAVAVFLIWMVIKVNSKKQDNG